MAKTFNDNIQNNSPKSLDNKYTKFVNGVATAYSSVLEANSTINPAYRSAGLTVLISVGGVETEHWYHGGISDSNLVVKIPSTSTPTGTPVIGGGNGGSETDPVFSASFVHQIVGIGGGLTLVSGVLNTSSASYALPIASSSVLGGIKVGNNLTIDTAGVLSANAGLYTLPTATTGNSGTLGGVKIDGQTITINQYGVISTSVAVVSIPTTIPGNNGTPDYIVPAGTLLEKFLVIESNPIQFGVGTNAGGTDLVSQSLDGTTTVITVDIYFDTPTPIYFTGTTPNTVVKLYKR